MQEIVYLSNSFCKKDFPNNQAGNFQNKLNKSLTFKTKGKVALSEILYTPGSWDNVRHGNNAIGIEISKYPVFEDYHPYKELFVFASEIIEAGQFTYSDAAYAIYRERNGVHVTYNHVGKYTRAIATQPFQRLTVKIKETKIDASTTDSTYVVYDSLYRTYKSSYNNIYWYYDYVFDDALKKPTEYNKKSVWIINREPKYTGAPVSTTKFLRQQNYENVDTILEFLTEQCNDALEELLRMHALPRILEWPYQSIFYWPLVTTKKKNWIIKFYSDRHYTQDIIGNRKLVEGKMRLGIAHEYPVKVKITLHASLAYMLGLTEYLNIHGKLWDNNRPHDTIANYGNIDYQVWTAETMPDLKRNTLRSICIFSDIIDSNFVGDKQMPLMRMLPIDFTTNQIPANFFIIQTYYNVNKINVETVKIWITEHLDGEPIHFNSDIYIKLVFDNV